MKSLEFINEQPKLGFVDELVKKLNLKQMDSQFYLKTLKDIIENKNLFKALRKATQNENYINSVSNHSYSHSNGFDKFVLDSSDEFGLKLRLHIWWKNNQIIEESDIHNHPWDYASYVISGEYEMIVFEAGEGKQYFESTLPTLQEYENNLEVDSRSKFSLIEALRIKCPISTYHYLHHSQLHKITSPKEYTATIILQGPHINKKTKVLNEKKTNKTPFDLNYITNEEVSNKLNIILDRIQVKK